MSVCLSVCLSVCHSVRRASPEYAPSLQKVHASQQNASIFTIYHQGFFHSVRRNPSLNCYHRRRALAILGHAGPKWRIRLYLHLVLGLPCRLVHSRGVHSVTLLVHLLSVNRAMCPAHPCIPFLITSMMSFTPV